MHILNGDSAAGAFKQTFRVSTEDILVFRDVLSCGGLTEFSDMKSWAQFRRSYWGEMFLKHGFGSIEEIEKAPRDFYNDFDELKGATDVNLWLGVSLSDHLLLVYIVTLFTHYGLDVDKLKIYQYEKINDNRMIVIGLGMLNPEQIAAYKPDAITLSQTQIKYCLDVWEALVSETPDKLIQILRQEALELPLLHQALKSLFYRFPDSERGLSHFDHIILEAAKKIPSNTARIIGAVLAHSMRSGCEESIHTLDTVGDIYLFNRLKNMAGKSLKKPLLSLNVMDDNLRNTKTEITEFGLKVLAGEYNAVQANGIEDWVAGIHLDSSKGEAWFRQGDKLMLESID